MAACVYLPSKPKPAAAGHSWAQARTFAIAMTNLPRGS